LVKPRSKNTFWRDPARDAAALGRVNIIEIERAARVMEGQHACSPRLVSELIRNLSSAARGWRMTRSGRRADRSSYASWNDRREGAPGIEWPESWHIRPSESNMMRVDTVRAIVNAGWMQATPGET